MVDDEQLAEVLGITDDLKEACELLIAMANDAGGADNITAVLVRCEADAPREASSPDLSFDAEPSSMPASFIPASSIPPSSIPPRSIPPRSIPPRSIPPRSIPPSSIPPSSIPPSSNPLSSDPLSSDPLSSNPLSSDPLSSDPLSSDPLSSDPAELAQLAGVVPPEVAELLESGAEVDIGEPRKRGATPARCRCCDHEVLEGNRFCVECGTLIHW
jgi:hypothetical protein